MKNQCFSSSKRALKRDSLAVSKWDSLPMARALGGQGDKECYYTPGSLVLLTMR